MNAGEIASAIESLADQMIADVARYGGRVDRWRRQPRRDAGAAPARSDRAKTAHFSADCAALDVYSRLTRCVAIDGTEIFDVEDRTIVLVDDVINSGWTVQRAMATIWQRGRPAAVKLAVLIDRGHRAVPIRPNYVGKNIPTARTERVQVRLAAAGAEKSKSHDRVMIYSMVESLKEPEAAHEPIVLRGGRVIDPAGAIDGAYDVLVRDGEIAAVEPAGSARMKVADAN